MRLRVDVQKFYSGDSEWISADVEDEDGGLLGKVTAPVVDGALFDVQGAVIKGSYRGGHTEDEERVVNGHQCEGLPR